MPRKPKIEYRIACSGKDQPWHSTSRVAAHRYDYKSLEKADEACAVLNMVEDPVPLAAECMPWHVERREVGHWERVE